MHFGVYQLKDIVLHDALSFINEIREEYCDVAKELLKSNFCLNNRIIAALLIYCRWLYNDYRVSEIQDLNLFR